MPTILSTCSIVTGHASTHAPQVRQSQTASYGIAVSTSGPGDGRRAERVVEPERRPHGRRVGDERQAGLGLDRLVADAHDERLGVERLAGGPRRARLLAAAALGAGEPVEQVLPRQVGDGPDAERRVLGLEVHRRQLAARRELAQRDVGDRRRDVEVLAERQVAQEQRRRAACAPTSRTANSRLRARPGPRRRSDAPPAALRDERAVGSRRSAATSKHLGEQLGQRRRRRSAAGSASASRLSVRRSGRATSRRQIRPARRTRARSRRRRSASP